MADEADIAQQHELEVQEAIRARIAQKKPITEARLYCAECDGPIPEARRKAIPGVQLCVECQSYLEKR